MITELLCLLITFLIAVHFWIKHNYEYWERHNVPYIKPNKFFGNIKGMALLRKSSAKTMKELYENDISESEPIVGIYIFNKPALLIREPELMKRILIKDFNSFPNRYMHPDKESDKLGAYNLKLVKNPIWKEMRTKLTPVFTSGKIKQMFNSVNDIGKQFNEYLKNLTKKSINNGKCEIELKELCALYATDVIASVAFGIDANSIKNPDGDFRRNGRKLFVTTPFRRFEFIVVTFLPWLVSWLRVRLFSKEATKFLCSSINYVMDERSKTGQTRNDLIDVLLSISNESKTSNGINLEKKIKFDSDLLVAQAAIFFIAGFEPTSTSMSMGLYELSKKLDIQKRIRDEIKKTLQKYDGKLTYEAINDMTYLHMVMQEILRLYPGLVFLERECKVYKNDGYDGYNLEPYSNFTIPNGMSIYIPLYSLHRDPKYFPNPNEFDPERFSPANKDKINLNIYMPFGGGPRNCIGERFGLMQIKIGLINFFMNHYIRPSLKSKSTITLANTTLLQCEGGIYCELIEDCI